MRQESKIKIEVRGKVVGGPNVLICLPLVGSGREEILVEAEELARLGPDLIEWRVDGFSDAGNGDACCEVLGQLREILGEIPLILTFRIALEGGMQNYPRETRLSVIQQAMASGNVDLVDIELCNDGPFKDAVRRAAGENDVKLIFSHHNFDKTPELEFIHQKLFEAQEQGGDIAKIAVMPQSPDDVLTLLAATNRARNTDVDIPLITISMASAGAVTRLAGGLFGSDVTFAVGKSVSAPGQINYTELKSAMELLMPAG